MKLLHTLLSFPLFLSLSSLAHALDEAEQSVETRCQCPTTEQRVTERRALQAETICNKASTGLTLMKRADGDDGDGNSGVGVGVGVNLPSVGLSLGNITTKLGNINLTVTNVTIALGNVDVENISIGNITVIVSVPLPGASPVNAFSAFTPGSSIASSTATPTSTVSSTSVSQPATTISGTLGATSTAGLLQRIIRQESDSSTSLSANPPVPTVSTGSGSGSIPTVSLPDTSATASVGGGPIGLNTGSVSTEIGNISILVGHINVSVGDIKIKNITLGNIFVLVQIGQPDLNGALGNLTNALGGITA
ncbi:hypothetical protein D9758_013270 [Tetrapyrgos nigripes]|uniref:Uncharacterized protein n=1 Tax=Tetrapyrgos nigripes TaxID=182062 RepID=A0A8H5CNX7_9AGAR|nr:hypothetical protein D9758_013270 [Tetrapyrgos nigripes]